MTSDASSPDDIWSAVEPAARDADASICWHIDRLGGPEGQATSPHEYAIKGWMFGREEQSVWGTVSREGMPLLHFTCTMPRADVVEAFRGQFKVPLLCGFHVIVPLPDDGKEWTEVGIAFSDWEHTTTEKVRRIRHANTLAWPPPSLITVAEKRTTLVSHFFNEEYLLPLWLRHHVPLFDHGILINRGSTDRSVAICQEFAPHWEVRDTRCLEFDAPEVDREVMDIEAEVSGWKTALNTTEFLCVRSREAFFTSLSAYDRRNYSVQLVQMIDSLDAGYEEFDTAQPLSAQRCHGLLRPKNGTRFIHDHSNGAYMVGRHESAHQTTLYPMDGAVILKLQFSPWNAIFKQRKLQIAPTLSQGSVEAGYGTHHAQNASGLERQYAKAVKDIVDFREVPKLKWLFA
jgi:hypothetical protein